MLTADSPYDVTDGEFGPVAVPLKAFMLTVSNNPHKGGINGPPTRKGVVNFQSIILPDNISFSATRHPCGNYTGFLSHLLCMVTVLDHNSHDLRSAARPYVLKYFPKYKPASKDYARA